MSPEPLFKIPSSIPKEGLEEALQQAINLEIATIPTYLYTYYSIKRSWSQTGSSSIESKKPIDLATAEELESYIRANNTSNLNAEQAQQMALDVQLYANKAASLVMSVVIEEMLHMALTSNVKQSLFGPPSLAGEDNLPLFPAHLPGHEPYFPINAAKLTQDQLKTFLLIESPEAFTGKDDNDKGVIEYETIGDFYRMIMHCVTDNYANDASYDTSRPQLLPGRGHYGPNSINTVHYDKNHNPVFPSDDDSGNLVHVTDVGAALKAMNEVVEQGEGHQGGDHLTSSGAPICPDVDWNDPSSINPEDFDDPGKDELSHFAKFLSLYCEGEHLIQKFQDAGLDFHSFFVYSFPDNPRLAATEGHIDYASSKDASDIMKVINAVYTYTFLMVEACYYNEGNTQFEVFMLGVHKSMIWVLSELCNAAKKMTISVGKDTYNVGPTFEWYDFSKSEKSPKQQIIDLLNAADQKAAWGPSWYTTRVSNFPDVTLGHQVMKAPLLTGSNS